MKASISVAASGVSTVSAVHDLDTEAVGSLEVTVTAGASAAVDVQPGPVDRLRLVFITADSYAHTLTYTVTGGPADIPLDGPQLFMGAGMVGLLGATPNVFTFDNSAGPEDVTVTILVGRALTG